MWNIPNLLTLLRLPLAFLFIYSSPEWRTVILVVAAATDGLDGFIARYFQQTTPIGTILDPIMDKLFAGVVICIFLLERKLNLLDCLILFSRDLSVFFYGLLLWSRNRLTGYQVRAIWTGKLMTFLQFVVFLLLSWNIPIPMTIYAALAVTGLFAFVELVVRDMPKQIF